MARNVLPHQQRVVEAVLTGIEEVARTGTSCGIALIGPSGSGKSYTFDLLRQRLPVTGDGTQRIVPFCGVQAPTHSDTVAIARALLNVLNKPFEATRSLKARDVEPELGRAFDRSQVQAVGIEEFQNAKLVGSAHLRGQLNRAVKNLWNAETTRPRVYLLSGTEEIDDILRADRELGSRFSCRIRTNSVWFTDRQGTLTFPWVVHALTRRAGLPEAWQDLDSLMMARLLFACRAHLRELESLLRRAATLVARAAGPCEIIDVLAIAFEQVIASSPTAPNPFRWSTDELGIRVKAAEKK